MTTLPLDKAVSRRRLLRANIVLGLLVFAIAIYLNITGEYANLAERTATEALYNKMAIEEWVERPYKTGSRYRHVKITP